MIFSRKSGFHASKTAHKPNEKTIKENP